MRASKPANTWPCRICFHSRRTQTNRSNRAGLIQIPQVLVDRDCDHFAQDILEL